MAGIENMAEMYNRISMAAFILFVISLAFTIFLGFRLQILKVINDLNGRTARKAIEKMRIDNEKSGIKSFYPSPVVVARGTITDKIESAAAQSEETELLTVTAEAKSYEETAALGMETETYEETAPLEAEGYEETAPLRAEAKSSGKTDTLEVEVETDLQKNTEIQAAFKLEEALEKKKSGTQAEAFIILQEIILIHTQEII